MKRDGVSSRLLDSIEHELLSGEELKWVAQPLPLWRMWRKSGSFAVITALLLIAWWLATLALAPAVQLYVLGLAGFIAALIALLLVQDVIDAWQTIYAITSRRVIVLKHRSVISYGTRELERIERRGSDVGDIIFADTHRTVPGFYGTPQDTRTQEGLFAIPHVREVEALLLETFHPPDSLPEKIKRLADAESEAQADQDLPESARKDRQYFDG